MKFTLMMVVLLLAVTLSLAQNRAKKKRCESKGGECVARSKVPKNCKRLSFTCPKRNVCCKKKSDTIIKRKCRERTDCLKVNGTCIPVDSDTCASTTQDDLCEGASCTCCPNSLTTPICKTKKPCSKKGGYCLPRWESSNCDGTLDHDLCDGRYCTCCIPRCLCGVANEGKVVGGEEVLPPNKYPWLVPLFIPRLSDRSLCGGSIITDRHILTAAHCLPLIIPARFFSVGIAEHNQVSDEDDIPGVTQLVPIKRFILHRKYSEEEFIYDIGIIELRKPLDLASYKQIKPICLPKDDSKTYEGEDGIIAGWGKTDLSDSDGTEEPLEAVMPILSPECKGRQSEEFETPDTVICTVLKKGGVGTCSGDSGGPLVVKEGETHIIVGIASYIFLKNNCAERNLPNVFTRTSKFLDWIKENTAGGEGCSYPR